MATSITLIHNPEAGYTHVPREKLIEALEQRGFDVHYCNYKTEAYVQKLQQPGALVVIAGGDGTILKVSRHLIHKGIPIGLLPLGTANNIAACLGISGSPEDLIASWDLNKRKPLDVGITEWKGTKTYFLESAGLGLLPRLAEEHSKDNTNSKSREEALAAARRHLQDLLVAHRAAFCTLSIDGREQSGQFLLVQVMNAGFAGPRLALAPAANMGDGLLDVVLVHEKERSLLAEYLAHYQEGALRSYPFKVQQAKTITLAYQGKHYHVGIESHEATPPIKVRIEVLPKGLEFLASS